MTSLIKYLVIERARGVPVLVSSYMERIHAVEAWNYPGRLYRMEVDVETLELNFAEAPPTRRELGYEDDSDMEFWFRPNGHWNVVSREAYDALRRAGYDDQFLRATPKDSS